MHVRVKGPCGQLASPHPTSALLEFTTKMYSAGGGAVKWGLQEHSSKEKGQVHAIDSQEFLLNML